MQNPKPKFRAARRFGRPVNHTQLIPARKKNAPALPH
jgi:hypothetical protein